MELHGIPWNLNCANFADTSSSMELHWIPWNLKCANFDDTSSSIEFHGTRSAPISLTRAVPWNSMELGVRQFLWHGQFHGIPWNLNCANFADMSGSMEFHGTWSAPISMTQAVPWNSMELGVRQFRLHKPLYGILWNYECANFVETSSSMELHWIPWNLKCANFDDTSSSMEFHGT